MASKPKKSIARQLNTARVAISNSLSDPEIQGLVSAYGYTAEKLGEGQQFYDNAQTAVNAQIAAAGAQYQTTAQLRTAWKEAVDAYQSLAKVARAIFVSDPARLDALGLNRTMPKDTAGFLGAAYALFDNALAVEEIKTAVASYGYPEATLQGEREKITACDSANQAQEAAKGAAQQATRDQEAALKALNEWTAQFIKIARVALRNKKQLLEKIGVPVRVRLRRSKPKPALVTE